MERCAIRDQGRAMGYEGRPSHRQAALSSKSINQRKAAYSVVVRILLGEAIIQVIDFIELASPSKLLSPLESGSSQAG